MLNEAQAQVELPATLAGMTMTEATSPEPETYLVESRYGPITFTAEQVVTMERPVLGFPHLTRFGMAHLPGHQGRNLLLLQSLEDASVSFPCLALDLVNPMIEQADIQSVYDSLEIPAADGAVLCILTARQNETGQTEVTANLRAPVFVDSMRQIAWQMVLTDARYPIRHAV